MDFFAHQDAARKASRRLTLLFVIAVIVVVVAVNLATGIALQGGDPILFGAITIGTLALVLGGSAFKTLQLRDGGSAVAEMMGGRRITPATTDIDEKRLINVVEEMALASGVPVPLVYVMDHENGLNAFAAGYSPNDAAVAVTHGLMHTLNRDELQGVIAHEFSHILNGDMRLNVRMIGLLFGIEMIGHTGRVISRVSDRSDGRSSGGIAAFGIVLFLIGAAGVFMANMIRAAIGRQREYLADASAVQFTRNPDGIGSALLQIAAESGVVEHQNADEVSHMFIASALESKLDGWFATHPPIETRIERIFGPSGRARMRELSTRVEQDRASAVGGEQRFGRASGTAAGFQAAPAAGQAPAQGNTFGRADGFGINAVAGAITLTADRLLSSVGQPEVQHVDYAKALLAALPDPVRAALGTASGAKAMVLAMLASDAEGNADLAPIIAGAGEQEAGELARSFLDSVRGQNAYLRLPIVSLALPTLRPLPREDRERFLKLARAVIRADQRVTPFEFALMALLGRALSDQSGAASKPARHADFAPVKDDVIVVLSLFVRLASEGSVLFDRLMGWFGITGARLLAPTAIKMEEVERALERIVEVAPLKKPLFIKACLEAVTADGKVNPREAELMRAVCATLDSPLPPIIDVQVARALEASAPGARSAVRASA